MPLFVTCDEGLDLVFEQMSDITYSKNGVNSLIGADKAVDCRAVLFRVAPKEAGRIFVRNVLRPTSDGFLGA